MTTSKAGMLATRLGLALTIHLKEVSALEGDKVND